MGSGSHAENAGDRVVTFQCMKALRLYVAQQAREAHEWRSYDLERHTALTEARRERSRQLRRERQARYRARRQGKTQETLNEQTK